MLQVLSDDEIKEKEIILDEWWKHLDYITKYKIHELLKDKP